MNLKRFLLSVIDDGSVVDGPEVMPAIDLFNEKLRENGHWIFAWGLHSPERSYLVDNREGRGWVDQGSLFPTKVAPSTSLEFGSSKQSL